MVDMEGVLILVMFYVIEEKEKEVYSVIKCYLF